MPGRHNIYVETILSLDTGMEDAKSVRFRELLYRTLSLAIAQPSMLANWPSPSIADTDWLSDLVAAMPAAKFFEITKARPTRFSKAVIL